MISILGSSGSIGTQTIEVAQKLNIGVAALAVGKNIALAEEQARMLRPKLVAVYDEEAAKQLTIALSDTDIRVGGGMSAILVTVCLLMVFATLNVVVKTRKPETAPAAE